MWLSKAKEQLRRYGEIDKARCKRYISELRTWIAEFEATGKVPSSRAYEMVMGNE